MILTMLVPSFYWRFRRTADLPYDVFKPALDSMRGVFAATTPADDSATVAAMRPRLEQSLIAFNPEQLVDWSSPAAVRLDGTCATQETSPIGIIPATGRVLDVQAKEGVVRAMVELVHVALVVPEEFGDVCAADRVTIRHRVGVDTLTMSLQRIGVGDTSVAWSAMGALRRPEGHPNPTNVALFPISIRKPYVTFWPGVSESYLQDRIDSLRRVRASTNR